MSSQAEALSFLAYLIDKLPNDPSSLKEVLQACPPEVGKPVKNKSYKEYKNWVSLVLLSLWWPVRNSYRPSYEQIRIARKELETCLFSIPTKEMLAYLKSGFGKSSFSLVVEDLILRYTASLVCFFQAERDNPLVQKLYRQATKIRKGKDSLIFSSNITLAVPDIAQVLLTAIACVHQKKSTRPTREEALAIGEGLVPVILKLSIHHNTVTGHVLRFMLGEVGLSMYDVFDFDEKGGAYRFEVSKVALQHIVHELKQCSTMAASTIAQTETGKRLDGLFTKLQSLMEAEEATDKRVLSESDDHFFTEIFRSKVMVSELSTGTKSLGCPLARVQASGENGMTSLCKEVLKEVVEKLYS